MSLSDEYTNTEDPQMTDEAVSYSTDDREISRFIGDMTTGESKTSMEIATEIGERVASGGAADTIALKLRTIVPTVACILMEAGVCDVSYPGDECTVTRL